MDRYAVLDFETTGLSTNNGDRATEIGIVITENGKTVDKYSNLMRSGQIIPRDVEILTGITNEMMVSARVSSSVIKEAYQFVGKTPLVAHNASFDKRFWEFELSLAGIKTMSDFICTMKLSRRLYPNIISHKLGDLITHHGIQSSHGNFHRALYDAEMTSKLLTVLTTKAKTMCINRTYSSSILNKIQSTPASLLHTVVY